MPNQNRTVNDRGKIIYSGAAPKDTLDLGLMGGKDLSKDATNTYAKPGPNPEEASPSSTAQSRNK